MLRLVTVCRPAKVFYFYSGHPDVCSAITIITKPSDIYKILDIMQQAKPTYC